MPGGAFVGSDKVGKREGGAVPRKGRASSSPSSTGVNFARLSSAKMMDEIEAILPLSSFSFQTKALTKPREKIPNTDVGGVVLTLGGQPPLAHHTHVQGLPYLHTP
nr:hypothetical protein Iba_chr13fCG9100 [Ipomoea batatas]